MKPSVLWTELASIVCEEVDSDSDSDSDRQFRGGGLIVRAVPAIQVYEKSPPCGVW